jgi:hypothetical protein
MMSVRCSTMGLSKSFVDACHYHFEEYNGYFNPPYHPDTKIFVVHRGNKDIGYYVITGTELPHDISAEFWMHPRTCPMGLLALQKAAAITCYTVGYAKKYKRMILRVKDSLSGRTVKKLCPGVVEHKLGKDYILMFLDFSHVSTPPIYKLNDDYSFEIDL